MSTEQADPARMFAALGAYMADRGSTTTSAKVEIQAGGVGVWFCATALAVVCAIGALSAVHQASESARRDAELAELRREIQVSKDYLAAIYAQAPHLKPEGK